MFTKLKNLFKMLHYIATRNYLLVDWDRIRYHDIYELYRTHKIFDDYDIYFNDLLSKYNIKSSICYIKLIVEWELGTCSDLEEKYICTIAKGINAKKIFEIGTYKGRTTCNIARNIGEESRIYTLNLPKEKLVFEVGQYIKNHEEIAYKVTQLYGDSKTFDFSPYYGEIDFMFIDGAHDYKTVISDSENALHCLKKGGFIIWHDFKRSFLGNSKAIIEICKKYSLDLKRIVDTSLAISKKIY